MNTRYQCTGGATLCLGWSPEHPKLLCPSTLMIYNISLYWPQPFPPQQLNTQPNLISKFEHPTIHLFIIYLLFCLTLNKCEPKKTLFPIYKPKKGKFEKVIQIDRTVRTSSLNRKNPQQFMDEHVFCWTIFQSLKFPSDLQFDKFKFIYKFTMTMNISSTVFRMVISIF